MCHTNLKTVPSAAGRCPVVTQAAYDRCEGPRGPKTTVKSQRRRPSASRRRLEALSNCPAFWKKNARGAINLFAAGRTLRPRVSDGHQEWPARLFSRQNTPKSVRNHRNAVARAALCMRRLPTWIAVANPPAASFFTCLMPNISASFDRRPSRLAPLFLEF